MDGIELQQLIGEVLGMVKKKKNELMQIPGEATSLFKNTHTLSRDDLNKGATIWFDNLLIRKGLREGIRDKSELDLRTIDPPGGTSTSNYSTPRIPQDQLHREYMKQKRRKTIDV